jgi:hypothetical protein
MSEIMSRRFAILAAVSLPGLASAFLAGCSGGDPNQFVSGTMVKPLESVEKADEIAAKKLEATLKSKGSRKKRQ